MEDISDIGGWTVIADVTATTQAKALGETTSPYLELQNVGSNACFACSTLSGGTIVFPTSGTGQRGTYIQPGAIVIYEKNSEYHTHLACICAAGLTTTLVIKSTEGI